jgi:hypothetical protein
MRHLQTRQRGEAMDTARSASQNKRTCKLQDLIAIIETRHNGDEFETDSRLESARSGDDAVSVSSGRSSASALVAMRKSHTIRMAGISGSHITAVWNALGRQIKRELDRKRGLSIPGFGKFFWDAHSSSPIFQSSDAFAQRFNLTHAHSLAKPKVLMTLNYSQLAHECNYASSERNEQGEPEANGNDHNDDEARDTVGALVPCGGTSMGGGARGQGISKEVAKIALGELLHTVGEVVQSGLRRVRIELKGIGALSGDRGMIRFSFKALSRPNQRSAATKHELNAGGRDDGADESASIACRELDSMSDSSARVNGIVVPRLNMTALSSSSGNNTDGPEFLPPLGKGLKPITRPSSTYRSSADIKEDNSGSDVELNGNNGTLNPVEWDEESNPQVDDVRDTTSMPVKAHGIGSKPIAEHFEEPSVTPFFFAKVTRKQHVRRPGAPWVKERNLKLAFDEYEKKVAREVAGLRAQEDDIRERSIRADMQYKERLLESKRVQVRMCILKVVKLRNYLVYMFPSDAYLIVGFACAQDVVARRGWEY